MSDIRKQRDACIKRVLKQINQKVEQAAMITGENLVEQAHVDTGLYAANWQVGIDIERRDDKDHEYFGIDSSQLSSLGNNKRLISEEIAKDIATDIPEFKLGQEIIFSNSVPYFDSDNNRIDVDTESRIAVTISIDEANQKVGGK